MTAVRFVDGSNYKIEGLLAPFTGPFPGNLDTYATRFTPKTDFAFAWLEKRPLLFQHGLDPETGITPVGTITDLSVRADLGVWMQGWLDTQSEYFDAIREMVEDDKLFLSSGSVEHLVQIDARSGDVLRWPIVEGSLTPTPANTHAFVMPARDFRSACRTAGIAAMADDDQLHGDIVSLEAFRAKLDAKARDALSDSDFAYIDSDGGRHLPINDAAHVKAALARFDQTTFASDSDKAAAKRKIMAAAKKFGVDVSEDDNAARSATRAADDEATEGGENDDPGVSRVERSFEDIRDDIADQLNPAAPFGYMATYSYVAATFADHVIVCRCSDGDDDEYYRIPYTLGSDGEPVLGSPEPVEQAYIAVPVRAGTLPLTLDAERFTRHAAALRERTQDLSERRYREGRMLSTANRQMLSDAHSKMAEAHEALGALLQRADGMADEAARAARVADPDARRLVIEMLELSL